MNRREFFINAMNAGRFAQKRWLIAAFSVMRPRVDAMADMRPWDILYVDYNTNTDQASDNMMLTFIDGTGNIIHLDDFEFNPANPAPPYTFKETLKIASNEMINVGGDTKIETTYGNVVANWLLCVHPFGDKIPYIEGRFSVKDVEKYIEKLMVDYPPEGEAREVDKIYVDEYFKYRRSASLLDGLSQLCVPSATPKSMTRHPDTVKRRNELLEQYKDRLHDPAIIAKIEAELGKLDLEWLKDDKSMGFYIKQKSLDVVRKKAHLMFGYESAFSDGQEGTLIEGPLTEGWDIEKLPEMASALREGSYDRGASTALGGEAVKFILRVMQNTLIEESDCKSKLGMPVTITKDTKTQYLGNWLVIGKDIVQLTDENIDSYTGREVVMRSPLFCVTKRASFCSTCIGGRYGDNPTSLATAASNVGSTFMAVFMASMHGKALKTQKYDFKTALT
jgi:hypothetical protein